MTCTCPYAEENEYCKHMAAVLFAAEAAKEPASTQRKSKAEKPGQNWKQVLEQMTLDETKRFVELLSVPSTQSISSSSSSCSTAPSPPKK